jgi:hypothetical protein
MKKGKTTTQRGYGGHHQALRKRIAPQVAAGQCICSRCGDPIKPGETWDLDHDDQDRSRYLGPSHSRCNRSTAKPKPKRKRPTLADHPAPWRSPDGQPWSRDWGGGHRR